jgi:mannitol-1-phosphate 5-dehydrogenase
MKQAVIFGAGNVGRGFIGQLFSESGYEVTLVDVDEPLINALREKGSYTILLVDNEGSQQVTVSPVRALSSATQQEEVAQALARASLAATAVGARVLPAVAPLLAAGIRRRAEAGLDQPLNLIVCENLKDAAAVFRDMVYEHLAAEEQAYARAHVGFVDTVIGRMVPPPTAEMRARDPSLIQVEPYRELPVDRRAFIGEIPQIKGMEPCDNFPAYTARKLYIHNCGHAVLAYLGYLRGYQYGYEALADPEIYAMLDKALSEARQGIVAGYGVESAWLEAHIHDLLRRFANRALGDTVFRLGRDPLRKLAPKDRLVGAARLAEKAGITPEALSWGIAAGYCFDPADDPIAVMLQQRLKDEGLDAVMASVSDIWPGEALATLVRECYQAFRDKGFPLPYSRPNTRLNEQE